MEPRRTLQPAATNLVDLLDRVLDKGLVVAGDIRISLANIELITIRIRLLVCSIEKAQEIGLDWWRRDTFLSTDAIDQAATTAALMERVQALERQLGAPSPTQATGTAGQGRRRQQPGTGR